MGSLTCRWGELFNVDLTTEWVDVGLYMFQPLTIWGYNVYLFLYIYTPIYNQIGWFESILVRRKKHITKWLDQQEAAVYKHSWRFDQARNIGDYRLYKTDCHHWKHQSQSKSACFSKTFPATGNTWRFKQKLPMKA